MRSQHGLLSSIWTWGILALSASAEERRLPPTDLSVLGPVYMPVAHFDFAAFRTAKDQVIAEIEASISSGNSIYGPIDNDTTSFSVQVFGVQSDEPLLDYHFEAPGLEGSTKKPLSENTVYRSGSLGKLMTVYIWMVDIGDKVFLDPITNYIPELEQAARAHENPLWSTNWTEVTIGSLASQLSGIGRDSNFGDFALSLFGEDAQESAIAHGYPPLPEGAFIECSNVGSLARCNREEYLQGVIQHPSVYPSSATAAYSNTAYVLLGLAYENITGRTMDEGHAAIFNERLGMTWTTTSAQPDADAVIPWNDTSAMYSDHLGLLTPAGGQYCTAKDLRRWGQAILNDELIPSAITRRWMKPYALTSQLEGAVGAPWEIHRTLVQANKPLGLGRLVDTYSKAGEMGAYTTFFGLVPDYNMGITVLAAGDNKFSQMQVIRNIVAATFYNAAEEAAKQQAREAFTGTFKASELNSSIKFAVDDGPGVVITDWISNGTDFLASPYLYPGNDFRLYPSGLSIVQDDLTWHKYHMSHLPNGGEPKRDLIWDENNARWIWGDFALYGNLGTQAFLIGIDSDGVVQSAGSQALRCNMTRQAA